METIEQPEVEPPQDTEELRLLLNWELDSDPARSRRAGIFSLAVHVLAILALLLVPRQVFHPTEETHRVTPLIAPPIELTQKAPNRGKISKEFNVESVQPRPRLHVAPPPAATRPKAPPLSTPAPKPSQPAAMPEPPKMEVASKDSGPKLPEGATQAPPQPQIQTEEKPKLALENPGSQSSGAGQGLGRVAPPSTSVAEAMRTLARGGGAGGMVVGDLGTGDAISQAPAPAKQGSNLELLSDPMGVDFKPYLLQILSIVRRNWFAVMPESVKQGRTGKVAIQFAIAKNGEVTKVVFATNSGTEALDRAAVASISMSNPFPPLPTEFRGNVVRLQFTYMYNARMR
jgi:TonB family protein